MLLKILKEVKNSCLCTAFEEDYDHYINNYTCVYNKIGLKVSQKMHTFVVHMAYFFKKIFHKYPFKGLGFWSELASKSVHYDLQKIWDIGYKVSICYDDLLSSIVTYNSHQLLQRIKIVVFAFYHMFCDLENK